MCSPFFGSMVAPSFFTAIWNDVFANDAWLVQHIQATGPFGTDSGDVSICEKHRGFCWGLSR